MFFTGLEVLAEAIVGHEVLHQLVDSSYGTKFVLRN